VAQLLQRSDFDKRIEEKRPIGVHELFYPLLQGYDSVAIQADVELGGTDQLFNVLQGREVQLAYGQPAQDVVTVPLLVGLDGTRKMSKSLDNAVALADSPEQQFGQLMSLPDPQTLRYLELLTDVDQAELQQFELGLEDGTVHPRDLKAEMATRIVSQFHGLASAKAAGAEFSRVYRDHQLPSEVGEIEVPGGLTDVRDLLTAAHLAHSRSEAVRLVTQGAVMIGNSRLTDWSKPVDYEDGTVLRVGKRQTVRLRLTPPE
jgi:tyrosyl-tRNA synthetase